MLQVAIGSWIFYGSTQEMIDRVLVSVANLPFTAPADTARAKAPNFPKAGGKMESLLKSNTSFTKVGPEDTGLSELGLHDSVKDKGEHISLVWETLPAVWPLQGTCRSCEHRPYSLLLDRRCNAASCLTLQLPWFPCHNELYPHSRNVSKPFPP